MTHKTYIFIICTLFCFQPVFSADFVWSCKVLNNEQNEQCEVELKKMPLIAKGLLQENINETLLMYKLAKGQVIYFNSKHFKKVAKVLRLYLEIANPGLSRYFFKYSSDGTIILSKTNNGRDGKKKYEFLLKQAPVAIPEAKTSIIGIALNVVLCHVILTVIFWIWLRYLEYIAKIPFKIYKFVQYSNVWIKVIADVIAITALILGFFFPFLITLVPINLVFWAEEEKTRMSSFRQLTKEKLQVAKEKAIFIESTEFLEDLTAMIKCFDQDFHKPDAITLKEGKNDQ